MRGDERGEEQCLWPHRTIQNEGRLFGSIRDRARRRRGKARGASACDAVAGRHEGPPRVSALCVCAHAAMALREVTTSQMGPCGCARASRGSKAVRAPDVASAVAYPPAHPPRSGPNLPPLCYAQHNRWLRRQQFRPDLISGREGNYFPTCACDATETGARLIFEAQWEQRRLRQDAATRAPDRVQV